MALLRSTACLSLLLLSPTSRADSTGPPRRIGSPLSGIADDGREWPDRPEPPTQAKPELRSPPWRHGLADLTDLASSFEPTKRFDMRIGVGYQHREVMGQLKRE